jgi:hypothetical protein
MVTTALSGVLVVVVGIIPFATAGSDAQKPLGTTMKKMEFEDGTKER